MVLWDGLFFKVNMDCILSGGVPQTPFDLEQPMVFSRQDYWSRKPFPSPGDLPDPGIEPSSLALQVDSLPSEPLGKPIVKERGYY